MEQQGARAGQRQVVAARLDDRVPSIVRVQLRVDEVDLDLPSRDPAIGVHVLAPALDPIDDALEEAHVSRADDWQQYMYIVLHALALEVNRTLEMLELDNFLGPNYLVTIHSQPIAALEQFWTHCERSGPARQITGSARLFYSLIDRVATDYLTVVDCLEEEIDDLEHEIFSKPRRETVNRIFRLRRTLLRLRRILGTMREP